MTPHEVTAGLLAAPPPGGVPKFSQNGEPDVLDQPGGRLCASYHLWYRTLSAPTTTTSTLLTPHENAPMPLTATVPGLPILSGELHCPSAVPNVAQQ